VSKVATAMRPPPIGSFGRRRFGRVAAAGGLALALSVGVRQAPSSAGGRTPLIGRLSEGGPGDYAAFRAAMRGHGHPEVRIEERFAGGEMGRLPGLAAELLALRPDVLWCTGSVASAAAKSATSVIPVVIVSADAVGGGLVDSLARPGGNVTGLTVIGTDLAGKRIEIMHLLMPRLRRVVTVTHGPDSLTLPFIVDWNRASKAAAEALRLEHRFVEWPADADRWDDSLRSLGAGPDAALFFAESPHFVRHRDLLARLLSKHRVASMFAFQPHVRAGELCAYGVTGKYIDERVAWYVSRILGGAKPGDLPVEQPAAYELAIHRGTAAALGLTVPHSLLQQADLLVD
jgi:putative ABC transport system substrate-binding protein